MGNGSHPFNFNKLRFSFFFSDGRYPKSIFFGVRERKELGVKDYTNID